MASDSKRGVLLNFFLRIISKESQGMMPVFLRFILKGFETLYSGVVGIRNARYDHKKNEIKQLEIPVISVGNLTAGGTGKTPVVQFLSQWFLKSGLKPAVITRGYKAKVNLRVSHLVADSSGVLMTPEEAGDEASQLAKNLTGTPIWIGADRTTSGKLAQEKNHANILIMDDGFQHRKLHRDVDIVLVDALNPWGFGHVLPRGLLREPVRGIRRADIVLITRSDLVSKEKISEIKNEIEKYRQDIPVFLTSHAPKTLVNLKTAETMELKRVKGKKVYIFSGLGNPEGFSRTITQAGLCTVGREDFPDHHDYRETEVKKIQIAADLVEADLIITTEKDGVKLEKFKELSQSIWQLRIEVSFLGREEELKNGIIEKCKIDHKGV